MCQSANLRLWFAKFCLKVTPPRRRANWFKKSGRTYRIRFFKKKLDFCLKEFDFAPDPVPKPVLDDDHTDSNIPQSVSQSVVIELFFKKFWYILTFKTNLIKNTERTRFRSDPDFFFFSRVNSGQFRSISTRARNSARESIRNKCGKIWWSCVRRVQISHVLCLYAVC